MPLYEYKCKCGNEGEFILPLNPEPQICGCGETMQRKMSVCSSIMKPTGKQMALDTLNSNVVGGRRKAWAEAKGAAGLENPPKTVW